MPNGTSRSSASGAAADTLTKPWARRIGRVSKPKDRKVATGMASRRPRNICRYSSSTSTAGPSTSVRATDPGWKSVILLVVPRMWFTMEATMEAKFLIWKANAATL
ncbi:hypothetical protein D3C81_1826990 [compost metagenome]